MRLCLLAPVAFAILTGCAAVDNRASAISQIRAAEGAAIQAFGERDAAKAAAFYAPGAALMMTNMKTVKSADIGPLLKEMMSDPNFSMKFDTARIEAARSGDLGYTTGAYTMTMTDAKSKKVLHETGKYVTVYAKQADGSWKIIDDMNNPDAPAT
jgi:ketosteroid isomerase-like protein